jgi:hypothetical protein
MGKSLIFFEDEINPFKSVIGVTVSPQKVELKDGRKGYFLGDDWREEMESKGGTVEVITKNDLKVDKI